MAQKTTVVILDDIDGSEGASGHSFALDGVAYEIDLADENFKQLYDSLSQFIENARRVGRIRTPATVAPSAVRDWWRTALADGRPDLPSFSDRGRVPEVVMAAFRTDGNGPSVDTTPAPVGRRRVQHPGDDEVGKVYRLTGTIRGVSDHFHVSYPTASKWVNALV